MNLWIKNNPGLYGRAYLFRTACPLLPLFGATEPISSSPTSTYGYHTSPSSPQMHMDLEKDSRKYDFTTNPSLITVGALTLRVISFVLPTMKPKYGNKRLIMTITQ